MCNKSRHDESPFKIKEDNMWLSCRWLMHALWPLVVTIQEWALKSHWLQRLTLSDVLLKYPLLAQDCSLGLFESVTCMWVKTELNQLLNNIFFSNVICRLAFCCDRGFAQCQQLTPPRPRLTPPPQSTQTKPVFHSVLLLPHLSAASLRTGSNHTAVTCDRKCAKASGNNRISLFVRENAEECMRTKQRTCLLDFIYELDSLGKGRKQRSGGDLAEPCEDDEWVVTGSPFGASAHQNKPCEQCLLGKRVCGLWSCDKRHLSPSDQMPHTDWHKTLLCLLLFILY